MIEFMFGIIVGSLGLLIIGSPKESPKTDPIKVEVVCEHKCPEPVYLPVSEKTKNPFLKDAMQAGKEFLKEKKHGN